MVMSNLVIAIILLPLAGFVVNGLLGDGVAASTRSDPQAKSLGEYLRAKLVDIPRALLAA